MKGYPLGTGQTLLAIWGVLLTLFVLWVVVIPEIVWTVRKVRADRAWLRARAARKSVEERYVDPGHTVRVLPGAAYLSGVRLFDAQAEANRLADPAWFVPAERPSEEP